MRSASWCWASAASCASSKPALDDETFVMQLLSLRLAVILCHARRDPDPQALHVAALGAGPSRSQCAPDWAEAYPQSAHLLREEVLAWQKTSNWRVELSC
jgi:exopolyphosphatase/guanosine-5'-triphosphate,3'-diphosphate pyrophosphatase